MSRWDVKDLAEALAKNPNVRISRSERRIALEPTEPLLPAHLMPDSIKTPPTKTKYRNKVVEDAEHGRFDSQKEFKRYLELKTLEARSGEIKALERQHRIKLEVNGQLICTYVADFKYLEQFAPDKWHIVIEDVKSAATKNLSTYRIKKKLVKAIYGIDIRET